MLAVAKKQELNMWAKKLGQVGNKKKRILRGVSGRWLQKIKIVKNEDTTTDATRHDPTRHDATDYFDYFVKRLP